MTKNREITLKGLSISDGISIGRPYFIPTLKDPIPKFYISEEDVESEIHRYRIAIESSEKDLKKLRTTLHKEDSCEVVDILNAHLEILQDPFLTSEMEKRIYKECRNIESVFQDTIVEFKQKFQNLNDGFFQDRVRDIMDVSRRILRHLRPTHNSVMQRIPYQSVVLASELVPSDIAEVLEGQVMAFVTQSGGVTSHTGIIARAKGIPFVANIDIKKMQKEKIELIIVDGSKGEVLLNPTEDTLKRYEQMQKGKKGFNRVFEQSSHLKTETKDGFSINLFGNIESQSDIPLLMKYKASGVGLFRSEYFFLTKRSFPTEEEQYFVYKQFVEQLKGLPLVIRIFDVGGDKDQKVTHDESLKDLMNELNPVLGCRAIRFLIRNPKHLNTQLRAIIRASAHGNVHILIPMVTDIEELFIVRENISLIKKSLLSEGIAFAEKIPLGCMIEVPSSAIMSDVIAKEADFLSIGTNDLIQYVLAADRTNPNISNLYSPAHPSILRLIVNIVQSAQKFDKPLILCGEIAADPKFIPILLGLGIREFSVSVRHIPIIKYAIRNIRLQDALEVANEALRYTSGKSLYQYILDQYEKPVLSKR